MTDSELLLAISEMMDKKLNPINQTITGMQAEIKSMKNDLIELREQNIDIRSEIAQIQAKITKIELNQENRILPRLQNIEACYTSTYERYANGIEKMEATQTKVDLMQKVLTEHSEKLQKIS